MNEDNILLSDPDISMAEIDAVTEALKAPRLSQGPVVAAFEEEFAASVGRKHAVAVASGSLGLLLCLRAYDIGRGDEVIVSPYSWHQIAHAVSISNATPVFADIDYWSGTISPEKVEAKLSARTRAVIAGNTNGHPASWHALRTLAELRSILLLEDSTEAIGSRYAGRPVGSFGDCAIFDFSQPGPLVCGEGGMIVTDDADIAAALRTHRARRLDERFSVSVTARLPHQAGMSDVSATLGLAQLRRIDEILARRKQIERNYFDYVKSFEGIKDPYVAPEVDEVHWFLYLVHLGTRFTRSSRDAIIDDLRVEFVEAAAFCQPLHLQRFYLDKGHRKGECPVTEKVADRILALPFHGHLAEEQIGFIVQTAKDASVNVGAGSAIYL
ncbi:MAG: DegT/DnrJ/EryC1/StrS family aminotransferase [Gammaproteobacteria bacterium]|jgi:perosamine synthetase